VVTFNDTRKRVITCKISVHWIQADIVNKLQSGEIDLGRDSLRKIAEIIGAPDESPQKIKHHLGSLVKLGVISIIDGQYNYKP
jgi:hypothetical protein